MLRYALHDGLYSCLSLQSDACTTALPASVPYNHYPTQTCSVMPADQTRLHADVAFLTNLHPARNCYNLESLNKAADYIKGAFEKLHCLVSEQPFTADGRRYRNIIASFGPPDGARIIVGAHYDVCGDQPGADDNASAVAGLLETAPYRFCGLSERGAPVFCHGAHGQRRPRQVFARGQGDGARHAVL